MNKTIKKHCYVAILCFVIGWMILLFYRITRYGVLYIDSNIIWKGIAIGFTLFTGLEAMRVISKKRIFSHIEKRQYVQAYAIVFVLCFLLSSVFVLAYNRLRYGIFFQGIQTLGKIALLCIGLFILFCVQIWLIKKILETTTKGIGFDCSELMICVICIVAITFCFIPVVSDYVNKEYPIAYNISTIVSKGSASTESAIVGEIIKDRIISQTFICSNKGLYSIELKGATYARMNTGSLTVDLVDMQTEEIVEQWTLDASKFEDNSYFTMEVGQPFARLDMKGKKYRIDIFSENATPGNGLTLYYIKENYYKDGDFLIDGEHINGDLDMTLRGIDGPANYEKVRIILCILYSAILETVILLFFRRCSNRNVESKDRNA